MLTHNQRVALDTLIPTGHPSLPGVFEAGFEVFYEDFRKNTIFSMRLGFWAALFAAIWIGPLLIGRLPPISLYRRETRERALMALATSRVYALRQMYLLLKGTVGFFYGANRQVRDAIGFPVQFDDPEYRAGRKEMKS